TVAENLAFPLQVRNMGKSDIEERVKRALDMVELGNFGDRRPAQLSGGQQQRVAVARALVFEPELILMDEPLGALDKNLREQMQYEIKHIHERLGVTVVYVTHDQSEALTMSNRIAVFNDGVIQQLAPPTDLYEKPINSFVAQFIGENNKLSGTLQSKQDGICTVRLPTGEEVTALDINTDDIGKESTLSLRPERVFLDPVEGQCDNVFNGKVEEVIYLGDHKRVRMNVCGHKDFIVKVPNSTDNKGLQVGGVTAIGWSSKDCRALDPA
ncbi:MAG: ABC transporter ATP-binding protein, partial [Amphritea sp.]|nr:ABC transporter ATP-binding protein [Amphritea sp.]